MPNHQNKFFLSSIVKALKIKNKFKLYTTEKECAKAENKSADSNTNVCTKLNGSFNSVLKARHCEKKTLFHKILVEDSSEYLILKSVLGFFGGIFLTYICFMFLVFSLNFTLKRATYICMGLGVILSLGLAFSVKIRCTVFLCIPQLFSKRGRQALLAYAFILALSGPAKNTLHNVEVMSESLACTQEQLKQAENELSKCVQKPNAVAKRSIEKLIEKINSAVKDFKHFILQLYKTCFDILQTVFQAQKWLYSISVLCNKEIGNPAHRCLNLLAEAKENCEASVPFEIWKSRCNIDPYIQGLLCSVKEEFLCKKSDLPEFLPVLRLQRQLKNFKHRAMNIFYVSIESHQTYSQTNRSYTYHEEYQGMATEIRQKTDQFLQYFDFMSVIFGIFILVLFIKVIIYRHKFLTQDHFDNRYITNDFVDIDNTRASFQMETLLPLNNREKTEYIRVWSVRLVPSERIQLLSSFVFLIFATFKIIIHMMTDSCLYWILSTVRHEERLLYINTIREDESVTTVQVFGHGLVAALYQNITRVVTKESSMVRLDPTPCLPDPVPPDWNRYCQIIALVIICWLLALCEPYGLRLRHAVMVTYYPDRARERAIWLYNRIISNRVSFVKTSRRLLRRKYKDVVLEKTFSYKFMRKASSPKCLLCESTLYSFDKYFKCSSVRCLGLYCASCFTNLKVCCICSDPAKYGDLSDLSEEKDSSDEECMKVKTICEKQKDCDSKSNKKNDNIVLYVKKPNFRLYEFPSNDSEIFEMNWNTLIRPTLLFRVIQICKNKVPSFRNFRDFSDIESSDWDHSSCVATEESSVEDCLKQGGDNEVICEKTKKKKGRKKRRRGKMSEKSKKSHKSDKVKKSKSLVRKIQVFKKISPLELNFPVNKINMYIPDSNKSTPQTSCDADKFQHRSVHFEHFCFQEPKALKHKDSMELLRVKKTHPSDTTIRSTSKEEIEITDRSEKADANFLRENPETKVILDLMEMGGKIKKTNSQVFPFIDPINVHEFDPGESSDGELSFKTASVNTYKEDCWEKSNTKITINEVESPTTTVQIQIGSDNTTSPDSGPADVGLNLQKEIETSSPESDCQFYAQPYQPTGSFSSIKQPHRCHKIYCPSRCRKKSKETVSSSVVSGKAGNKSRRHPKTSKQIERETNTILKVLSKPQVVCSKRSSFFKAKVYQYHTRNKKDRKPSLEDGSTDIDDVKRSPCTGIFLSEDEFQQLSKQISSKEANKTRARVSKCRHQQKK